MSSNSGLDEIIKINAPYDYDPLSLLGKTRKSICCENSLEQIIAYDHTGAIKYKCLSCGAIFETKNTPIKIRASKEDKPKEDKLNKENPKYYPKYTDKHPSHEDGTEKWIKELKEENPDKKYYIITMPPIPDALELDPKGGKLTALEYETDKSHIPTKRRYYEKLGSDFNEVVIRGEDKTHQERFSPPKPNR